MKRIAKSMLGVTLLEIMLVLAVAAMIIVMSVRYYQSANASQQANQVLQQLSAINASAAALSQGSGTFTAVTNTNIDPLLSNVGGRNLPWGGGHQISVTGNAATYNVSIPGIPASVCGLIWGRLNGDTHYVSLTGCAASGPSNISYTYNPNV